MESKELVRRRTKTGRRGFGMKSWKDGWYVCGPPGLPGLATAAVSQLRWGTNLFRV